MSTFADTGDGLCASWGADFPPRDGASLSPTKMFAEATKHAWVFGFVVGAAHMSETRMARVDADTVDAWMDMYCAAHPRTTIGNAAATLVAELVRKRCPKNTELTIQFRDTTHIRQGSHHPRSDSRGQVTSSSAPRVV